MKKPVKETVTDIIGSIIKATPVIDDNTTLTDLGLDSLDAVQFLMSVESAFHIHLPDDTFNVVPTVNAFIGAVEKIIAETSKDAETAPADEPKKEEASEVTESVEVEAECNQPTAQEEKAE